MGKQRAKQLLLDLSLNVGRLSKLVEIGKCRPDRPETKLRKSSSVSKETRARMSAEKRLL